MTANKKAAQVAGTRTASNTANDDLILAKIEPAKLLGEGGKA